MLRAIQAFEAVARKENYADAALELNVTPAAIGQQVRALEAWLGAPLFLRLGNGSNRLSLTDNARAAVPEFTEGLNRLDVGLRQLRQRGSRALVTVSASQAVVARWLLPRLHLFTTAHPDIDVRLDVSDSLCDIERGEADLGIRCGAGRWEGLTATELMDEEVFPVASPALLCHGDPRSVEELAELTLIHDLTLAQTTVFPTWSAWFEHQGYRNDRATAGLKINSAAAVIQAALASQGVALARHRFVTNELRTGQLVRLLPQISWPVPWRYFVVQPVRQALPEPATQFRKWLVTEAAEHVYPSALG
ncbi:LysR substrate-binding domain-containing protein [Xanthomonas campestris pv. incanae]|uniref:LysR substrate-binding domain-containing protein n=1 Tax=Xanthomonas campestris TaxID=339 RepID=UPI00177FB96A|nr:LysR substrate-binding domain-containing protein [Xanthomonas campestris]MDX6083883.1 LysR substrate-binding domain-containing protein [Xanthomonas campestris pv. incanae]MDX6141534.1 LysR substrate-binding domain-containing protein [Xanthomonas campestris pv. incanae]MEB1626285.1 LysR substrate-binding domain-containing protein [Xanthomonas campestris pv. campestris]QOF04895.1 LysR family transcriptional regulator [Xanthomonas campestris]